MPPPAPDSHPPHADPRMNALLEGYPPELFDDRLYRSIAWADNYVVALTLHVLSGLNALSRLTGWRSADELCCELGLVAGFRRQLSWLLTRLQIAGVLAAADRTGTKRFRLEGAWPVSQVAHVRSLGIDIDTGNAATAQLLEAAAEIYPRLARGEGSGEDLLLKGETVSLWLAYFNNANPLYAISNRVSAIAAGERLAGGSRLRILEVGAGAGSGTEALLRQLSEQALLGHLEAYLVTEPSAFFRRRGERSLRRGWHLPGLRFQRLDIDRPWQDQVSTTSGAIADGGFDLIFAVNVMHVAKNLGFSLAEARQCLAPGGWLVAGESLRPYPGYPLFIEFVFQLLEHFTQVDIDPGLRPEAGFMTPEAWTAALKDAGFREVTVVPDHFQIREIFPNFSVAALCGR